MKSVMQKNFAAIPAPSIQRSSFNLSHGHKTNMESGYLYPVWVEEVLPGDTFKCRASYLIRLSTLLFPLMDNLFFDTFYFFVPSRLLWSNWEKFNGAQDNPADSVDFTIPRMQSGANTLTITAEELGDVMGLPANLAMVSDGTDPNDVPISALPFRAYNLIWNEWFRDQNLSNSAVVDLDDGPDSLGDYTLRKRGKKHDYFSSCLPWPQKGDAVSLPLGTTAPVFGDGNTLGFTDGASNYGLYSDAGPGPLELRTTGYNTPVGSGGIGGVEPSDDTVGIVQSGVSGLVADLATATAATINQLREAFTMQQLLERDARGGTRYTEMIMSHFGVQNPDFRLQRPEYLGGGSQRIGVSQVPQTAPSATPSVPVGKLAAFAVQGARSGFVKSFTEHGYIMALANIRADVSYQKQVRRMWTRQTREEFYLPVFAHLGEQAVLSREISLGDAQASHNTVFGYQERWAEYRYCPSIVTQMMVSDHGTTLDAWHLALDFGGAPPALNETFIVDSPPMSRILAAGELGTDAIIDCFFDVIAARPMPVFSVPGLRRL